MLKMLIAVVIGAAATLTADPSTAQPPPEVKVVASRALNTKSARTANGVPIHAVLLGFGVKSDGLDLASHEGHVKLERRVADAAKAACRELGKKYPKSTPTDAQCAKETTDRAMAEVQELEAAAAIKAAK